MIPRSEEMQREAWVESQMVQKEMPYTVLRGINITLVLTTTNGGGAALTPLQLAAVIQELRLKVNGGQNPITLTGEQLYIMNYYDYSRVPRSSIDMAAGAGKTQRITMYLPFALSRAVEKADTLLDLRKTPVTGVSTAFLEISFPAAAIGTNVTITSGYVYIETEEYNGVAADKPMRGQHLFSHFNTALNQTGEFPVKLDVGPTGGNEYRRFFILAKDNAGAFSNSQFDKLWLKSRGFTWFTWDATVLQDKNGREFSVDPLTGVYIIDTTTDGMMSERLDATKLDELVISVNSLVSNGSIVVLKEKTPFLK